MSETEKYNNSELILYVSADGLIKIDVSMDGETVWLSQSQMSELLQTSVSNINEHISNIYKEGELVKEGTMRKFGISDFSNN